MPLTPTTKKAGVGSAAAETTAGLAAELRPKPINRFCLGVISATARSFWGIIAVGKLAFLAAGNGKLHPQIVQQPLCRGHALLNAIGNGL